MKYTPKTEKEINESRLLPAGEYDFEIYKADDSKPSKAGDPMLTLSLRIFSKDGTARMTNDWILLTDDWAWKLRGLCEEVGLLDDYEAGKLDVADFPGQAGKLMLGVSKRKDTGEDQNGVKRYGPDAKKKQTEPAAPIKASDAPPAPSDDDVPF